jgi:hypothetical protein
MIPPLGKHYSIQWAEENARLLNMFEVRNVNPSSFNREYFEINDTVYEGDVLLGTLSQRILATLVREGFPGLENSSLLGHFFQPFPLENFNYEIKFASISPGSTHNEQKIYTIYKDISL